MAAVIGRGIERMAAMGDEGDDEVYNASDRGLQSPFILFYTVTFATNGVAILGGIFSELDLHRNNYYGFDVCDAWLFANACFGIVHIGIALYLVTKIREPDDSMVIATSTFDEDPKEGVFVTGYRLHNSVVGGNRKNAAAVTSIAGPPDSLKRIRYILCENKVFAAYIFVFAAYLCWHFFLDMHACNLGMAFAMRCADIFIWAAPCSFIFSVGTLLHRQRRV